MPYDYEMTADDNLQFKSWEVARATSAVPLYFPSFSKDNSFNYWDGGLHHNNPASIARQEVSKIWPELCSTHPDILLSIGSGYISESMPLQPYPQPTTIRQGFDRITDILTNLSGVGAWKVLKATLLKNIDSEHAWNNFYEHVGNLENEQRYFRLNPPSLAQLPALDDLAALENGTLDLMAHIYVAGNDHLISTIARRLIILSFYFELKGPKQKQKNGHAFEGMKCAPLILR